VNVNIRQVCVNLAEEIQGRPHRRLLQPRMFVGGVSDADVGGTSPTPKSTTIPRLFTSSSRSLPLRRLSPFPHQPRWSTGSHSDSIQNAGRPPHNPLRPEFRRNRSTKTAFGRSARSLHFPSPSLIGMAGL